MFLFERFFYFLEAGREHGVPVMDETGKREDRRFVARMEKYFMRTALGRQARMPRSTDRDPVCRDKAPSPSGCESRPANCRSSR